MKHYVRDQLLFPLALPVGATAIVIAVALNASKVFLALHGSGAVVAASIALVLVLIVGSWIAAVPRLRTTSLVVLVAIFGAIAMSSGLLAFSYSGERKEAHVDLGPADASLVVEASDKLTFQSTEFKVAAHVLELSYETVDPGFHTLLIEGKAGFKLAVNDGFPSVGKVALEPGEYTLYCDVASHRSDGMEAKLIVSEAPAGASGATGVAGSSDGADSSGDPAVHSETSH